MSQIHIFVGIHDYPRFKRVFPFFGNGRKKHVFQNKTNFIDFQEEYLGCLEDLKIMLIEIQNLAESGKKLQDFLRQADLLLVGNRSQRRSFLTFEESDFLQNLLSNSENWLSNLQSIGLIYAEMQETQNEWNELEIIGLLPKNEDKLALSDLLEEAEIYFSSTQDLMGRFFELKQLVAEESHRQIKEQKNGRTGIKNTDWSFFPKKHQKR